MKYEYTVDELKDNPSLQKEVFWLMLKELELMGKCRQVFHNLAEVLVKDSLGSA